MPNARFSIRPHSKAPKQIKKVGEPQVSSAAVAAAAVAACVLPVAEKQLKPKSERASAFGFLAVFPQCRPAEKKPQTACPSGSSEEGKKGRCAKRKRVEKFYSGHHLFPPRRLLLRIITIFFLAN